MKHPQRNWFTALFVACFILAAVTIAQAQIPDPTLSTAVSFGGSIFICPAGDGQTLIAATSGAATVDATITVTLRDANDAPVVGYPKEQIRVESVIAGELVFCTDGNIADADTDANGLTTFSGTFSGGGCTQGGLQVIVGGVPLAGSPLAIDVNSPDMNADLRIDLCDYVAFSTAFFSPTYSFCADFYHDGLVNLLDIIAIAQHFCAECPAGTPPPTITASGEIGVFFDTAGTQTGIMGLNPGIVFDFYIVALNAPGDIKAFQFGITVDTAHVQILNKTILFPAFQDWTPNDPTSVVAVLGSCVSVTGPTTLVHFQAILTAPTTDSPIVLGPPHQYSCGFTPQDPLYLSCEGACDWRRFYPAYQGDTYINGVGPVAIEESTWGSLKALFR